MTDNLPKKGERESGIELFRIITMLVIIAHHYVVNSGLIDLIQESPLSLKSALLVIFGGGGKAGINCFILITGYFMCRSEITLKKFLKLIFEIEFYCIIIYLIFLLTGYEPFSIKSLIKCLLPVYSIGSEFLGSYLVFFFFIPFLNSLINSLDEKNHQKLIILSCTVFSVIDTLCIAHVKIGYVGWFMILYFIAAYVRLYDKKIFNNRSFWLVAMLVSIFISCLSILFCILLYHKFSVGGYYYFVADSNKLLALVTSVSAFMFFKNLNLGHVKIINKIAASAFGVLLIHANSDAMRRWLWRDVLDNVAAFNSEYFALHAVVSVILIYVICTIIDMLRIKFVEKPFFKCYDKIMKI